MFGVLKLKQTPEEDARDKEKALQRAQAASQAVGEAGKFAADLQSDLKEGGSEVGSAVASMWAHVRKWHVIAIGVTLMGVTVAFPPYLLIDYSNGGVAQTLTIRELIGNGPKFSELHIVRLGVELLAEIALGAWLFSKAKK